MNELYADTHDFTPALLVLGVWALLWLGSLVRDWHRRPARTPEAASRSSIG